MSVEGVLAAVGLIAGCFASAWRICDCEHDVHVRSVTN